MVLPSNAWSCLLMHLYTFDIQENISACLHLHVYGCDAHVLIISYYINMCTFKDTNSLYSEIHSIKFLVLATNSLHRCNFSHYIQLEICHLAKFPHLSEVQTDKNISWLKSVYAESIFEIGAPVLLSLGCRVCVLVRLVSLVFVREDT